MRISAKVDYAVRAAVELAAAGDEPIKGEAIAEAQGIPLKFLENILGELKHSGIVASRRGAQGGYWLARPADEVALAEIVRAVEGPLATVRGQGPESLEFVGAATPLQKVWIAVRANLRAVMDRVTLADIVSAELPENVRELSEPAEAWSPR
jgi:Rrf2 family protein